MKTIFYIFFIAIIVATVDTGCKKSFEDLNTNENKPTSVPPSLLLNKILYDMYAGADQSHGNAPYGSGERFSQYFLCNYDYYGNNRYDFGPGDNYYPTLKNADKMIEEAVRSGLPTTNSYDAMAKFFKAYFFAKMSLEMGDIPLTQALEGTGNLTPTYDPQKTVFQQAFVWLDSANTELAQLIASNATISGDFYFNNDLSKWRKVVNTFRLRLLIHLSKKADDADLNVKQQFATILGDKNNYPIMTSMDDNLVFQFVHPTNNYPMNPDNFGFDALRYNTSATYISLLTQTHDPRVYITAEPATSIVSAGTSPTDFSAFVGADPGEDLGIMYVKANAGQYSLINRKHYYETYTGEPSIQIGYPELLFNIAEAINRGWVTSGPLGNAEDHYKAAIEASMAYYGIPESGSFTAYFLASGSPGSTAVYSQHNIDFEFSDFYNQASVKYSADNATALTQILKERYIALFRHSGFESYFTYRRTGVPTFTTGPGTGNGGRIAMRYKYPGSEQTANSSNYKAALDAQYGGNDDINGIMWLLK